MPAPLPADQVARDAATRDANRTFAVLAIFANGLDDQVTRADRITHQLLGQPPQKVIDALKAVRDAVSDLHGEYHRAWSIALEAADPK